MARTIGIGTQSFEKIREHQYFYVDKTDFIREWWENGDDVTLITRPRRFGKTLTMNMVETFFSVNYAGREDIFKDLSIWQEEKYQKLQGTWPVISLSFANIKGFDFITVRKQICQLIKDLYDKFDFLLSEGCVKKGELEFYTKVSSSMENYVAVHSLRMLSLYLSRYYKKNVIILLDEYDTPMQEAYVCGYWEELAGFIRGLFNSTFKTNPYLERAILTGITRISKESIFSDLNNLEVVTTTSEKYESSFGFTQEEVSKALEEYGLSGQQEKVKDWYDGFTFGRLTDVYNPWSIINYLEKKKFSAYWTNTSSNALVGKLLQEGNSGVKIAMEDLLNGKAFHTRMDEQIVFSQLENRESAIWSLLLASGYLRVEHHFFDEERGRDEYDLVLTNKEVRLMFEEMIEGWFSKDTQKYNGFIKALLQGDCKAMNHYMNRVALEIFSFFDSGKRPSGSAEPERFYHGFVLGLLVELRGRYIVISNRESGFGRYDVMLEPLQKEDDAIILEFKVYDPDEEQTLLDTVKSALTQIQEKAYAASLEAKGISRKRIRSYGFAFEGKKVLIGEDRYV
ncbi:MAG: AAA family ATPase [Lachnospiraceae bacterium]|nr:AAA family ATPase [Lachnospiraceae bacterium]